MSIPSLCTAAMFSCAKATIGFMYFVLIFSSSCATRCHLYATCYDSSTRLHSRSGDTERTVCSQEVKAVLRINEVLVQWAARVNDHAVVLQCLRDRAWSSSKYQQRAYF